VATVVALHRQREEWLKTKLDSEVAACRKGIAAAVIKGVGVECGAGTRPWPLPEHANCIYGDIRDEEALRKHFNEEGLRSSGLIDAQTFGTFGSETMDFVIHAHVLEHLFNPLGAIESAMRILRPGGVLLMAVPDANFTFDAGRPLTSFEHLIADRQDGGEGTKADAYRECVKYVYPKFHPPVPEDKIEETVAARMQRGDDIHVHAWTRETLIDHMDRFSRLSSFRLDASTSIVNETIVALRKVRSS
jgi:predicted SAM-dependent methyltransferase